MKSIHFSLRPSRDINNKIRENFVRLTIVADDDEVINWQDVRLSAWKDNEHGYRSYWKHMLLEDIKERLIKASAIKGYVYSRESRLSVDDATYDEWFRWYYYIDGEDASAFIRHCNVSQHTTNWQARCGVIVGWKFYKELVSHNFREDTAAMLAYARGYLTGMESNAPWDSEGMEALQCLGLSIEGGSDALRAF